ncbi:unnamed protein product [Chrysodeixis includens]|uniref:Uncharacterized protein n=1 Tax=Chrysodeixis includens TaxID=689277 RepID=A0A9N8PYZ3_CHRIL|nr:unnamed protein product [Chrysodeixis includens]
MRSSHEPRALRRAPLPDTLAFIMILRTKSSLPSAERSARVPRDLSMSGRQVRRCHNSDLVYCVKNSALVILTSVARTVFGERCGHSAARVYGEDGHICLLMYLILANQDPRKPAFNEFVYSQREVRGRGARAPAVSPRQCRRAPECTRAAPNAAERSAASAVTLFKYALNLEVVVSRDADGQAVAPQPAAPSQAGGAPRAPLLRASLPPFTLNSAGSRAAGRGSRDSRVARPPRADCGRCLVISRAALSIIEQLLLKLLTILNRLEKEGDKKGPTTPKDQLHVMLKVFTGITDAPDIHNDLTICS